MHKEKQVQINIQTLNIDIQIDIDIDTYYFTMRVWQPQRWEKKKMDLCRAGNYATRGASWERAPFYLRSVHSEEQATTENSASLCARPWVGASLPSAHLVL